MTCVFTYLKKTVFYFLKQRNRITCFKIILSYFNLFFCMVILKIIEEMEKTIKNKSIHIKFIFKKY